MHRRDFIKNALLAAGALAVPGMGLGAGLISDATHEGSPQPAAGDKYAAPIRKSIMWGTVGMEGSVLDKCRAIKAAGFDAIEPNSHMDRQEVLDAMKATGLRASSVCNSQHWAKPLSHPDAAVRQQGIDAMIVAMEDAKAYGTDAVLLVPGAVGADIAYDDCWNRSTECIRSMIPAAEKLGVKICIENVWNNFILSPIEACKYIDQFGSPYVRAYFDCGNILVYGWPEQWIDILGERVGRIHIKEFSREKADKEGRWAGFGVQLTEGDVDWVKVMAAARRHYKAGWMTTEQGGGASPEEIADLGTRLDRVLAM